jgi:hypothetical protein
MHIQVFMEVSFLGEGLVATQVAALERPLAGMNSEMVKEVVPLSEIKLASSKITLQNFDASVGSGVLVFEHAVTSGQGHLDFFDSDFVHVQGGAVLHVHWGVWRDLLAKLVVLDLITEAGVGRNLAVNAFFINTLILLFLASFGVVRLVTQILFEIIVSRVLMGLRLVEGLGLSLSLPGILLPLNADLLIHRA